MKIAKLQRSTTPRGGASALFKSEELLLHGLFDGDGDSDGRADHRVVAHAKEAHHLDVRRNGTGARELRIGVHTAPGVGHAVGGGAGGHVVRVQRAARAAAGGDGKVLLALLNALFLVSAGDRVLEAGRVGGVAGDGHVHALADVVRAVAADGGALALGVGDLAHDGQLAGVIIKLGLDIGEAVDTVDDLGGVLAETVEDDAQRLFAGLVRVADNADRAFGGGKGLAPAPTSYTVFQISGCSFPNIPQLQR